LVRPTSARSSGSCSGGQTGADGSHPSPPRRERQNRPTLLMRADDGAGRSGARPGARSCRSGEGMAGPARRSGRCVAAPRGPMGRARGASPGARPQAQRRQVSSIAQGRRGGQAVTPHLGSTARLGRAPLGPRRRDGQVEWTHQEQPQNAKRHERSARLSHRSSPPLNLPVCKTRNFAHFMAASRRQTCRSVHVRHPPRVRKRVRRQSPRRPCASLYPALPASRELKGPARCGPATPPLTGDA